MTYGRVAPCLLAALIPLAVVSCGDDPASIETEEPLVEEGYVTAAMHDSAAVLPADRSTPAPADSMAYDGTLSGTAQVEIYSDTDGWISLGDPVDVSFEIYCEESALIRSDVVVANGTYSQVRVTLGGFVANIDAGALIGTVAFANATTVTLGTSGSVVIEKSITPFTITTDSRTTLVFDLNSESWLDATDATNGSVAGEEIAAATVVYVK